MFTSHIGSGRGLDRLGFAMRRGEESPSESFSSTEADQYRRFAHRPTTAYAPYQPSSEISERSGDDRRILELLDFLQQRDACKYQGVKTDDPSLADDYRAPGVFIKVAKELMYLGETDALNAAARKDLNESPLLQDIYVAAQILLKGKLEHEEAIMATIQSRFEGQLNFRSDDENLIEKFSNWLRVNGREDLAIRLEALNTEDLAQITS